MRRYPGQCAGPILPGSTVGVLGGGQLGRMFAIAARRMGYRVHTLSPDDDTPTGQVADLEVRAAYDDLDAVRRFAAGVDVVTFEFENVAAEAAAAAAEQAPVRPAGAVLHTTQNRLREKTFLAGAGFPVAPFAAVSSPEEVARALPRVGLPAVLKSAGWGYDGKGQAVIRSADPDGEIAAAWAAVGAGSAAAAPAVGATAAAVGNSGATAAAVAGSAVLEAWVDFACEVSVVAARGLDGELAHFGVIENRHRRHILDVSIAPASPELVTPETAREAVAIARGVMEALDVVGVLCVELFLTREGRLLVNELAPRPHNSGHLTFDASATSQFEQQLRAICGLPLGSTELYRPAAMANLLGDLWASGEPDWVAAGRFPEVKLHLYGKNRARPGRKMGHLTALEHDREEALARVLAARRALAPEAAAGMEGG